LELLGFAETMAFEEIGALRRVWSTVTPDWNALDLAGRLQQRFSLSFRDALLIASCIEAGAGRLYSEDFGGCRAIESLEIVNPFEEA
jgi:predicted nucleic acid-binding protein